MTNAEILLDSVNKDGQSITTWKLTYHRFYHSEFMTHRVFSRNASSSRAIPVEKMLKEIESFPATPTYWGKNQQGMQASEELDNINKTIKWDNITNRVIGEVASPIGGEDIEYITPMEAAKRIWFYSSKDSIFYSKQLSEIGLHKQISNRICEPWQYITVIATATELDNFFRQRAHKDAQPEFRELAYKMLEAYNNSIPNLKKDGEWHIPFGDQMPEGISMENRLKIATARCARASYKNFEGTIDMMKDLALYDKLRKVDPSEPSHMSPFEHCAYATPNIRSGNFYGWTQYRKMISNEDKSEPRLAKRKETIKKLIEA